MKKTCENCLYRHPILDEDWRWTTCHRFSKTRIKGRTHFIIFPLNKHTCKNWRLRSEENLRVFEESFKNPLIWDS